MREQRDKDQIKASLFSNLRLVGADYAEATYSGGGDEGGVDDITLYRYSGQRRITVAPPEDFRSYGHPLWMDFDDLLSLDFGSWAGDFSASGTVYADLRRQRLWRAGDVSEYVPEERDYTADNQTY